MGTVQEEELERPSSPTEVFVSNAFTESFNSSFHNALRSYVYAKREASKAQREYDVAHGKVSTMTPIHRDHNVVVDPETRALLATKLKMTQRVARKALATYERVNKILTAYRFRNDFVWDKLIYKMQGFTIGDYTLPQGPAYVEETCEDD